MSELPCSPYLEHPPLTTREKRMLAAMKSVIAPRGGIMSLTATDPRMVEFKAIIAECEQAQS